MCSYMVYPLYYAFLGEVRSITHEVECSHSNWMSLKFWTFELPVFCNSPIFLFALTFSNFILSTIVKLKVNIPAICYVTWIHSVSLHLLIWQSLVPWLFTRLDLLDLVQFGGTSCLILICLTISLFSWWYVTGDWTCNDPPSLHLICLCQIP